MTCRTCLRIASDLAEAITEAEHPEHVQDRDLLREYAAAVQLEGWRHTLTEHPKCQTEPR